MFGCLMKTERFEMLNKDTELMKTFDYIVHEFFSQPGKVSVCNERFPSRYSYVTLQLVQSRFIQWLVDIGLIEKPLRPSKLPFLQFKHFMLKC